MLPHVHFPFHMRPYCGFFLDSRSPPSLASSVPRCFSHSFSSPRVHSYSGFPQALSGPQASCMLDARDLSGVVIPRPDLNPHITTLLSPTTIQRTVLLNSNYTLTFVIGTQISSIYSRLANTHSNFVLYRCNVHSFTPTHVSLTTFVLIFGLEPCVSRSPLFDFALCMICMLLVAGPSLFPSQPLLLCHLGRFRCPASSTFFCSYFVATFFPALQFRLSPFDTFYTLRA